MRSLLVLLLTTLPTTLTALGINCRGNGFNCPLYYEDVLSRKSWLHDISIYTDTISPTRWYADREKIACIINESTTREGICLFLQNSQGAYGAEIKELVHVLLGYGCKACGSVPLGYPETNDVHMGELTSNFVDYVAWDECSSGGLCAEN